MQFVPWSLIFDILAKLFDMFLTDKKRRDDLKMQMYEFARRFDLDAVDGNAKHRENYRQMREEMARKIKEQEEKEKAEKEKANG